MLIATVNALETQARARAAGVHVIRHATEGAIVALVTPTSFASIIIDVGPQMEAQITRAQARLEADRKATS